MPQKGMKGRVAAPWWATGNPPDLGACAAMAGAAGRNDCPYSAAQPDWQNLLKDKVIFLIITV